MKNSFSAMILAAGFGKRMMPLTNEKPKPLIDINGITLLDNTIKFLKVLGCDQIVINTHYMHEKIYDHIKKKTRNENIDLIYENKILDTGGAIKNAMNLFKEKNLLVVNSDIFWTIENIIDVKNLIKKYNINRNPHLLIVEKSKSNGMKKLDGDFFLVKNKIKRFKKGSEIFFYTGLQLINPEIFENFPKGRFSMNEVWDYLIKKETLFGGVLKSKWYHVGDIQGLDIAKEFNS